MDQLLTSFGPYGKAKIIYGDSGTAQLTKDGKAILEALHTVHGSCSIDSLSRLRCISIGSSLGDGTITAAILLGNLLESIDRYGPHGRVKLLQSFQIVRRILSGNVAEIMKCISRSYGFLVDDPKRLVEIIVRNIVAPSSSLEAAQKLSELMLVWLFKNEELLARRKPLINQWKDLLESCVQIKNDVEFFFFSTTGGTNSKSTPLDYNQIIIGGRCRENSTIEKFLTGRFICIKHFFSERSPFTFEMKNTSNSCLDSVFADISKMLCSCGVRLLLTSDDVYDADVNALVNLGAISIIDRIPSNHLHQIKSRYQCKLYENLLEFVSDVQHVTYPECLAISRIKHIDQQIYYQLSVDCRFGTDISPTQLMVVSPSKNQHNLQRNSVMRCLTNLIATLRFHLDYQRLETNQSVLLLPGGGSAELFWSIIFMKTTVALSVPTNSLRGERMEVDHTVELAAMINDTIVRLLSADKLWSIEHNLNLVRVFESLSHSCSNISRTLANNCGILEVHNSRLDGLPKFNSDIQNFMVEWRSTLLSECTRSRLGIIASPKLSQGRIFGDVVEYEIASSFCQFWTVLMHGLDGSIEYLRLGGKNAIIMEIKGGNHSDKTKFTRGIYDADSDSD